MVTINQQAGIPLLKADSTPAAGKEKTAGTESFLSFFSKSLNKPLYAFSNTVKAGESITKPMQSNRSAAIQNGDSAKPVLSDDKAVVRPDQTKETQPTKETHTAAAKADAGVKPETAEKPAEKKTEEKQEQGEENKKSPEAVELTQKSDQLLAIMDEIIHVLQQAATPSQVPDEGDGGEMPGISSKPTAAAVNDELQKLLAGLVETAEQLEGTKTAEHALAFAKKLQQLLGKDSFEALVREELEITVNKDVSLESLTGKMLSEAENAKMHLVQTSLQEITIPAMKAAAPQTPSVTKGIEVPEENEENAAQASVHEEKTIITEQAGNGTPSEQTEDGMREKPGFAGADSKETESASELKPQILAETAPNLKELQQETIITEPVRMQNFSRADVTRQIVEKAETMFREDKTEMILQLRPESLGKISLKVIHERGEIVARFVAENEQVKAILEGNMQFLKDSLQKSGVMVQSLEVSVGQQGAEQQRDDRRNEAFERQEPKASVKPQKVLVQPVYGYGSTTGNYSVETTEIDLTA